jgi:hypothetical protein
MQRLLPLPEDLGGPQEQLHRPQVRIERVEPVADPVFAGGSQTVGELIRMQQMLLQHVDTAAHQASGQLRAVTAGGTGTHRDTGDIDITG